jgi:hypothetical protein
MQMVGADWVKSNKREDDLGGRTGGLVQVFYANASNLISKEYRTKKFTNVFTVDMCSTRGVQILLHCKHTGEILFGLAYTPSGRKIL